MWELAFRRLGTSGLPEAQFSCREHRSLPCLFSLVVTHKPSGNPRVCSTFPGQAKICRHFWVWQL